MIERTIATTRPTASAGMWLAALLDWRPLALIALCGALLLLCTQPPLHYDFEVGRGTGPESDLPFLQGFHPAEPLENRQSFRWSKAEEARIELPGIGQRGAILAFDIVSHRAQWDETAPPTQLRLQPENSGASVFTLRREGAHYQVYLPPEALSDGALRLGVITDVWNKPDDSRDELGVAIGRRITLSTVRAPRLVLPDRALLVASPIALLLLWVALRVMRFAPRPAALLLLPLAIGVPLLLLLDAPRLGFGSGWAIQFGSLMLLAGVVCAWGVPVLLGRLGASAPPALLRWLLLLIALSFALKYGGRLYPDSMPGDIQLHVNRYAKAIMGELYVRAQHRGLPFPFPTGPYLLLAPLTLVGLDTRFLLQLTAGLFEASTVLLLYLIARRALGSARLGVLAGAIYALTSAGFMTTWFAFETQVAAQWFSIVLLALVILAWPRLDDRRVWWMLLALLGLVFLGHIGLFINVTLLGLLAAVLLWLRANGATERRAAGMLLLVGLAAGVFAMLFFYSAFADMIMAQLGGVAAGGLNAATGRNPIPRATTLWVTWQGGLITHFGFFPVLLMVPGLFVLSVRRYGAAMGALLWMTLAVSVSQAILPLLTLSSITTRWLMFSAWVIAVAGAAGLALLWRRGRVARLISLAMAGYVGWLTVVLWAEALALRKPPIEPF